MNVLFAAFYNNEELTHYTLVELNKARIQGLIDMLAYTQTIGAPFRGQYVEIRLNEPWAWLWFKRFDKLEKVIKTTIPDGNLNTISYMIVPDKLANEIREMSDGKKSNDIVIDIYFPHIVVKGGKDPASAYIYFACVCDYEDVIMTSNHLTLDKLQKLLNEAS